MNVLGLDHIYLTVSDIQRAEGFYDPVMQALGFRKGDKPVGGDAHAHYFNPILQLTIRPARSEAPHDRYAPGLHHLCLQLPTRHDVDEMVRALRKLGVSASDPQVYPEYSPDYYATFFEDPDGLRFELVSRRADRDDIQKHWNNFTSFLNPLSEFRSRKR